VSGLEVLRVSLKHPASKPVKSMALLLPAPPFSFGSNSSLQPPSDPLTMSENIPMPTSRAISKKASVDNYTFIKSRLEAQDSKIILLKNTVMNLRVLVGELEREQEEGAERTTQCESQIARLEESITKLLLGQSQPGGSDTQNEKKNSNALNVRIRHLYLYPRSKSCDLLKMAVGKVLNKMMGIEKGQDLPTPLPGSDDFWLDVGGENLLRPKFEVSWTANIKWHSAFVTKFKNDAHTIDPYCPKSIIDDIDKTKLKKIAGNTTFKNLKLKYKEQRRPNAIQEHNVQEDRRDDRKMKVNLTSCYADRFIDNG
jgi:hypothetical protein